MTTPVPIPSRAWRVEIPLDRFSLELASQFPKAQSLWSSRSYHVTKKSSSDLNKSVIYAEKGGMYSLTDELSV